MASNNQCTIPDRTSQQFSCAYREWREHILSHPRLTPTDRLYRIQLRRALREAARAAWLERRAA